MDFLTIVQRYWAQADVQPACETTTTTITTIPPTPSTAEYAHSRLRAPASDLIGIQRQRAGAVQQLQQLQPFRH